MLCPVGPITAIDRTQCVGAQLVQLQCPGGRIGRGFNTLASHRLTPSNWVHVMQRPASVQNPVSALSKLHNAHSFPLQHTGSHSSTGRTSCSVWPVCRTLLTRFNSSTFTLFLCITQAHLHQLGACDAAPGQCAKPCSPILTSNRKNSIPPPLATHFPVDHTDSPSSIGRT